MTSSKLSGDSEFDLSDFLTGAARRVQSEARGRGVMLVFDYEGPLVWVRGPEGDLAELLDQVLLHSVSLAPCTSQVFLRAQVECTAQAMCSIDVHVVGSDIDTRQAIEPRALQSMTGVIWTDASPSPQEDAMAHGYSEAARAIVTIHAVPQEGTVVRLQAQLQATDLHDDLAAADAHGARAWLIADPPFAHEALARRLQRLGWTTTLFSNVSDAVRQLLPVGSNGSAPAMVLASEQFGVALHELAALMRSLPATTYAVYTTPVAARERLRDLPDVRALDLRTPPLAPRELAELTQKVLQRAHPAPSGDTHPAPLGMDSRRHVLVVEDNPVNQMLAREMVQLLGFEVEVVDDGAQAVEYCRARAPHAVLMDLQMPVMDGYEATRHLRELQRAGRMPHFPIVAATASGASLEDCLRAGMDGCIAKPLRLAELGALLRDSMD